VQEGDQSEASDEASAHSRWSRHALWLLILIALASWSYLAIWTGGVANFTGFYVTRYLGWTVALMVLALTVVAIVRQVAPAESPIDRGYAVAALGLILFQSQLVFDAAHAWVSARSSSQVAWAAVAVVVVLAMALTYRVSDAPSILIVFTTLAAFLVAVPAFDAVSYLISDVGGGSARSSVADADPPPRTDAASPDVYVVVLDAYARSDVLRGDFGLDNSDFEEALAELGVQIVPDALANYTFTMASIASLLDGRYPLIGRPDDATVHSLEATYAGDNALFVGLRAGGYETHLFENAWTFTRCGRFVEYCHRSLLTELDHAIFERTPVPHVVNSLRISPWVRGSVDQLRAAAVLAQAPTDTPRLVFLHALIPHPPFQLDRDCNYYWDPALDSYYFDRVPEDRVVSAYVGQVECTNRLVLDLLEATPRDAIVLLTSDHGPRTANLASDQPRGRMASDPANSYKIFTAYRFPASCVSIPDGASLVDAANSLLDCVGVAQTGVDPRRAAGEPTRHYELELGTSFRVTDVSSEVAPAP
jgi:hypothetical protein